MTSALNFLTDNTGSAGGLFANLQPQSPDPLLSLIGLYRIDPRPEKIDLGVGVYRDVDGVTPVFAAVKSAEAMLVRDQATKAYLGPEGDLGFLQRLAPIVFAASAELDDLIAVQTPGGTGALRLAAELVAAGRPGACVWLGTPSWPIHRGIFRQAGLEISSIRYFDTQLQSVTFDTYLAALEGAEPGDVVLLHGSCHNPSGADPTTEQWSRIAELLQRRGATPLVDLAYQGLGEGLDEDAAGLRLLMDRCETVLVAQSCDKNFGLYRERTGTLFVKAPAKARDLVRANVLQLARCLWSMPPDHGAAVVRLILESEILTATWQTELAGVRERLRSIRAELARLLPALAASPSQHGMFALLPLTGEAVQALRRDHAIYMADSGRINLAGLGPDTLPIFARALAAAL